MAIPIYNSTTLSEAVGVAKQKFTVASTSNILAGYTLAVQGTAGLEIMHVSTVPVSGTIEVQRGWGGTRALSHASGARVFINWTGTSGDGFKTVEDSIGVDNIKLIGNSGTYPDFALPGTRARDGIGNEYVMVELTATAYGGTCVTIAPTVNFTAVQTAGGTHGSVGILVEPGTSDQYVWAQIYGYQSYAQLSGTSSSDITSAYIPTAATSVSTPSVGLHGALAGTTISAYIIHGMHFTGAAVSTGTSATSYVGQYAPVWLNYPYVNSWVEGHDSSGS